MLSRYWHQSKFHQSKASFLTLQSNRNGNNNVAGARVQWCGSVDWRFPMSQETSSSTAPHRIWAISSEPSLCNIPRNQFTVEGHIWGIFCIFLLTHRLWWHFHVRPLCSCTQEQWARVRTVQVWSHAHSVSRKISSWFQWKWKRLACDSCGNNSGLC